MAETEGKFVDYLLEQPKVGYFSTTQIAVAIKRPYHLVLVVVRMYRALEMVLEMKIGNEIYVQLDPVLR